MNRIGWSVVLAAIATAGSDGPARGSVWYTVTDLGTFGGSNSYARDVNEHGQVVGDALVTPQGGWSPAHAYRWENGSLIDLTPGPVISHAFGNNDLGVVAGGLGGVPVLWTKDGLIVIGNLPGGTFGSAAAINNAGVVVGASQSQAFMYRQGRLVPLPTLPETSDSGAADINDSGQAVGSCTTPLGTRATIWENGTVTDLGSLPSSGSNVAHAISSAGKVVGRSSRYVPHLGAFVAIPVMWKRDPLDQGQWQITELPTLGGVMGVAEDISSAGRIVGQSDSVGDKGRATLWAGGEMIDLNDVIPSQSGWTLWTATGTNDHGQIVGRGISPGGQFHAYLLTPTACIADFDQDGGVGPGDLVRVLDGWGGCDGCPEDLDATGTVGIGDLLVVLSRWGVSCD